MPKQETLQPQKRRGPKPTGKGAPVQVRLQPDPLSALDAWREQEEGSPTRPEAIRRIVNDWLRERGYLPRG